MTDQPNVAGQPADLPASLAQSNAQSTTAAGGVAGAGLAGQGAPGDASSAGATAQGLTYMQDPEVVAWREQLIEEILARIPPYASAPAPAPTAAAAPQVPSICRFVVVRAPHRKDAPGVVTDVRSDTVIDVQVFRGDHLPHAYLSLSQIDPANTAGEGWFWPPRE